MLVREFVLTAEAEAARSELVRVLEAMEFDVEWTDEWTAVAQKGSRTKNVLFGAFAPFVKVALAIRSLEADGDDEPSVVRIEARSSGLMGGLMGASRTRGGLFELRTRLRETFEEAGVLVEIRDPGPSQLA